MLITIFITLVRYEGTCFRVVRVFASCSSDPLSHVPHEKETVDPVLRADPVGPAIRVGIDASPVDRDIYSALSPPAYAI